MAGVWIAGGVTGSLLKRKKHSKFCKSFMFYISCQGGHLNPAMTFAFASTGKRKMDLCKHAISEYT